jgi:hypothetical protein
MNNHSGVLPHHTGRRTPPPAEVERLMKAAEQAGMISQEQRTTIDLELRERRRRLEQMACSSAWVEQCWEGGVDFPPKADSTPMKACQCERCRQAGRLWPQHYGVQWRPANGPACFISYECYLESLPSWDAACLASSPSGLALRAIREARIKLRRQRTFTKGRRFLS